MHNTILTLKLLFIPQTEYYNFIFLDLINRNSSVILLKACCFAYLIFSFELLVKTNDCNLFDKYKLYQEK